MEKTFKPGGFIANSKFVLNDSILKYGSSNDYTTIPRKDIKAIFLLKNGMVKSDIVFLGQDGQELLRIKELPNPWAQDSLTWLLNELQLQPPKPESQNPTLQPPKASPPNNTPGVSKMDQAKGTLGCLSILVVFFVLFSFFGSCGSSKKDSTPGAPVESNQLSPEELKQQQVAFSSWYGELNTNLTQFDNIWGEWKKTFDAMSAGQLNRYEAYSKFKVIAIRLDAMSSKFYNFKPPTALSKEDQKILSISMTRLSSMADSRRAAAEKVMKMLDENDYKPSKTDEVLSLINKSESDMLQGFAGIIEIRKKLNLLDDKN